MINYKNGDIVSGCVTGIEKYGIFVNLDQNHNGLVHISEISTSFVRNINDYVDIGEKINVQILDNTNKERLKLSIKNIDYRINRKASIKIQETKSGFSTLKTMLDKWVASKTEELEQKNH